MQAIFAVIYVVSVVGGLAYAAWIVLGLALASIEELKQPDGPSKGAVALWTFAGTCLLVWLLR